MSNKTHTGIHSKYVWKITVLKSRGAAALFEPSKKLLFLLNFKIILSKQNRSHGQRSNVKRVSLNFLSQENVTR